MAKKTVDTANINITATDKTQRGFASAKRGLAGMEKSMRLFKAAVVGAIAVAAVAALAKFSLALVNVASDIQEMTGKFNAVFKGASKDVEAWAASHAQAVGRSRFELQGYLATLQDTFVPMGIARGEAVKLSQKITELGIDLASFNNIADASAINKLTSAIIGNHEAVQSFGISITQTALKQELLNMGVKGGVQGAQAFEKAMARVNIIMARSGDAHGDAGRTVGNYANQVRALEGNILDLKVMIGESLLPIFTEWITKLNEAAPAILRVTEETLKFLGLVERPEAEKQIIALDAALEVLYGRLGMFHQLRKSKHDAGIIGAGEILAEIELIELMRHDINGVFDAIEEGKDKTEGTGAAEKLKKLIPTEDVDPAFSLMQGSLFPDEATANGMRDEELEEINKARLKEFEIAAARVSDIQDMLKQKREDHADAMKKEKDAQEELSSVFRNTAVDSLTALANGYGDLKSVAIDALGAIIKATIDYMSQTSGGPGGGGLLASIFGGGGGGGGGGFFSSFFGGGGGGGQGYFGGGGTGGNLTPAAYGGGVVPFAEGGSPPLGKASLVGEEGPELWTPNTSGTIHPTGTGPAAGGGTTVVQNINIHPEVGAVARQQILNMLPLIKQATAAAVVDNRMRAGNAYFNGGRG